MVTKSLTVNGESRTVAFPVHHTLLEVLREELGLTGTKHGCGIAACGACVVYVEGQPVRSRSERLSVSMSVHQSSGTFPAATGYR